MGRHLIEMPAHDHETHATVDRSTSSPGSRMCLTSRSPKSSAKKQSNVLFPRSRMSKRIVVSRLWGDGPLERVIDAHDAHVLWHAYAMVAQRHNRAPMPFDRFRHIEPSYPYPGRAWRRAHNRCRRSSPPQGARRHRRPQRSKRRAIPPRAPPPQSTSGGRLIWRMARCPWRIR